jgi:hypothetical protein
VYIYNVKKKKDDTDEHGRNIGEVTNAYIQCYSDNLKERYKRWR